jgi:hypothetical protein
MDQDKPTEVKVFIIPQPNLGTFQAKLEKLQKKAVKLGCHLPTYTILQETTKELEDGTALLLHHITLSFPSVMVAGYQFLATLEHTEEGNVVRCVKGCEIPTHYRTANSDCDHCHTIRRRNDTFVLQHTESQKYLQVGRNCLADFLGWDAERYAAMAELSYDVSELGEASESLGSYGSGGGFDYLERYLGYVAECITLKGWRSRSTAQEYGGA